LYDEGNATAVPGVNFEGCVGKLCDISVYGGWPGPGHALFAGLFCVLAVQIFVMQTGRVLLLRRILVPGVDSDAGAVTFRSCCGCGWPLVSTLCFVTGTYGESLVEIHSVCGAK
jgi:hypothetical protein